MWLAVVLLLPYYGAEAYGLGAVGRYARDGHTEVLTVAESFRYAPFEVTTFGVGLMLLAVVGGLLVRATWGVADGPARLGGALTGLGLATFLPQFFAAPELRMAHGVVLGLGLAVLAWSVAQADTGPESGALGPAQPLAGRPPLHDQPRGLLVQVRVDDLGDVRTE